MIFMFKQDKCIVNIALVEQSAWLWPHFSPWWWFLVNWNVGFLNKILRMIAAAVFVFNFLINTYIYNFQLNITPPLKFECAYQLSCLTQSHKYKFDATFEYFFVLCCIWRLYYFYLNCLYLIRLIFIGNGRERKHSWYLSLLFVRYLRFMWHRLFYTRHYYMKSE